MIMTSGSGPKIDLVAAPAPTLPVLCSERLLSWFLCCEANIATTGITSGKTMVQNAIGSNVTPDPILGKLSDATGSVYSSDTPWDDFKMAL